MLQGVNMSTNSLLLIEDPVHYRAFVARAWALAAFPSRGRDPRFLSAFLANRHLTLATRQRLAKFFEFGPADGMQDEVMFISVYIIVPLFSLDSYMPNCQLSLFVQYSILRFLKISIQQS